MSEASITRTLDRALNPADASLPSASLLRALTLPQAALLVALCLALFLPGFGSLPPIDRDEARFAQATKQMVETGDYVDIRFRDEARHKKPVGIYWLQSLAVHASGQGASAPIWVYRLPSLLGATAAVLALAWSFAPLIGASAAVAAAVMLASCVLIGVEARLAKTDAVLLFTIVLAQGVLARAWMGEVRERWSLPLVFWTAIAAGVLVKGPLILMVVGLSAATLVWRRGNAAWLSALRPGPGAAWALLLIAPWFVAIGVQTGGTFFGDSVGKDLVAKVGSGQEAHWAPPGTYAAVFWGTFWPWAPLLGLAAPWLWAMRREPAVQFCLAWVLPSWLVLELVPTKLPHYVLPLYPGLAVLLALALAAGGLGLHRRFARIGTFLVPGLGMVIALGAAGLTYALEGDVPFLAIAAGLIATVLLAFGARALGEDRTWVPLGAIAGGAVMLYFSVFGLVFPALNTLWLSPRLQEAVERALRCPAPEAASAGFREPSLTFLAGTRTVLTEGAGAAEFLIPGACRVALVEARREAAFLERAEALGRRPVLAERVEGVNISRGVRLDVGVYHLGGAP